MTLISLPRRAIVLPAVLLLAMAVAGCATTLGTTLIYNHADWWIARQLDGYFDLSRSQKLFVSARLSAILERHRREALPHYEEVLLQVHARVQDGLTPDDLEWTFAEYDRLKADLLTRFVPDGAEFVGMVKEPQIARVRKGLEKRLEKQEQLLRDGLDARVAKQADRLKALANEWLGSMTRQQEEEITRLAMTFSDTLPALYEHERRRNERVLAVLASRFDGDNRQRIQEWLIDQNADPAFVETTRQLRQHITQFILALDRLATPQQRHRVMARLDDLAGTIRYLRG